jgi:hypothetical protein
MEGRELTQTVKYKEVVNDWNYDSSCMLTLLLDSDLENFKSLVFVAQTVPKFTLID